MATFHMDRKVTGLVCVAFMLASQPAFIASAQSTNITVQPLSATFDEVNVLKTTMQMKLDGQNEQKAKIKGDMKIVFAFNLPKQMAMMEMNGPLVTMLLGNDAPMKQLTGIGIYDMGKNVYMLMDAQKDTCMTMPEGSAGELLGENPMQTMGLEELTSAFETLSQDGALTGRLMGKAQVNGIATARYALDADALDAFKRHVRKSSPSSSQKDTDFKKAELWVARNGDYLVQFNVQGVGKMETLEGFNGNVSITYAVANINNAAFEVTPPTICTQ